MKIHSRDLGRETDHASADRVGETRPGISPRGAALARGIIGSMNRFVYTQVFHCLI